jgi:acetyl-CoA acetyltransferase
LPVSSDIAIVGVGHSACGSVPGASELSLHGDAAVAALDDAGLSHKDVDGLLSVGIREPMHIVMLGEFLNIRMPFADSSQLGGETREIFVEHAAAAIGAGLCHTVLLTYGSTLLTSTGRSLGTGTLMEQPADAWQFELPYGFTLASKYAMAAQRHMYDYGTKPEDLAQIAVKKPDKPATRKLLAETS